MVIKLRILKWGDYCSPKCNHKCPHETEAEGDLTTDKKGEGNVSTEAETGVMLSQAKECQQPPEAGRGKERILP